MDTKLDFEKTRDILDRISWPLAVVGIWPKKLTLNLNIRFILFMTYFGSHLLLELMDLVSVMRSLELVILNLMETGFQTMAMFRIIVIRFNELMQRIIDIMEENLVIENFNDAEEVKIMVEHLATAEKFYRLGFWCGTVTAFSWYMLPLQTYLITRLMNGTAILINPYRIYTFLDTSSTERTAMLYLYQFPMMYTGLIYVTSYSVMMAVVSFFCGHLAILTHKMRTMCDDKREAHVTFRYHTQEHLKIITMAQWLNDAFQLVLLYDLLITTVLISLIIFKFLLNIDHADPIGVIALASYIISMTVLVYANCYMGEYLKSESSALLNAYYECSWYEMSPSYKQALIICKATTREPLRITAGKFYEFTLERFAQIMKSSMVYVSILRTVS